MAEYLITGGCGFIGQHLVRRLVGCGHRVVVVDDLSTGDAAVLPPGVELIECDAGETKHYASALASCDAVIHLAAIASVARSLEDPEGTRRVNFGTLDVILDHLSIEDLNPCVLFTSSAAVYGDLDGSAAEPDGPTQPLTPYGRDKLDAERSLLDAQQARGLRVCALRLFNVYGPGQRTDSMYSGVITNFATAAHAGESLVLYGDGSQTRDFIHVQDVVATIAHLLQCGFGDRPVRNVCSGESISIRSLAQMILDIEGGSSQLAFAERREGDIRVSVGVPDPMLQEAVPVRGLDAGLAELLR